MWYLFTTFISITYLCFVFAPQRGQYGVVEGDFALAMSLYHGYELLQLHGLRSLFNFLDGIVGGNKSYGRTRSELMRNADFNDIMTLLRKRFQPRFSIFETSFPISSITLSIAVPSMMNFNVDWMDKMRNNFLTSSLALESCSRENYRGNPL